MTRNCGVHPALQCFSTTRTRLRRTGLVVVLQKALLIITNKLGDHLAECVVQSVPVNVNGRCCDTSSNDRTNDTCGCDKPAAIAHAYTHTHTHMQTHAGTHARTHARTP